MKIRWAQWPSSAVRAMGAACAAAVCAAGAQTPSAGASSTPGISDNVVKIGVMTDMSGMYTDLGGKASVNTAQMAIDDFKLAHKPAFKIELVYADHQNKADIASSKAREWFDVQGVDMVTDGLNSATGLAVAKIAGEKKKVVLNTGTGSMRFTNEDCTPYTVAWVYDTYSSANVAARAVVQGGGDTWAFLTADYTFGHSLERDTSEVVKAMGGKVLGAVRAPLGASDFSSYLIQLQATKAKVIGLANGGADTINSIKAANDFGLTKDQKLVGLVTFISDIHALGLKATQGMLISDGWYWDTNDETRTWARRFFEKNKRMPSMLYAGIYSATYNYLEAVQTAKTDDADAVMKVLRGKKINDMFAKNGYIREDGRMIHDMYLMQVKTPEESKYAWDYLKRVATVPGDQAFQPLSKSTCPLVKKPA
ncbi:MAG: transporter permease [Variovorax sp.]|nr:transporter permease [Variovorax sp.]